MARDSVPVLVFKRAPARQVMTTEVLAYLRDGTGGHPFPVQVDALLGGGVPDVVHPRLPDTERVAPACPAPDVDGAFWHPPPLDPPPLDTPRPGRLHAAGHRSPPPIPPREKSAITVGAASSSPTTSSIPGSSGSAMVDLVAVAATTMSLAGMPVVSR